MNEKEWTIMIYMAGDNNLSVDMAHALEQIKQVSGVGANLLVYFDGNSPSIPTLYCDFSEPGNPKYERSYKVKDKLYPVTPYRNENAAKPESVLNFVDWCLNTVKVDGQEERGRRAKKYGLIFGGHSMGFQDIGLFKDESSGKSMNMKDLGFLLQRLVLPAELLEDDAEDRGWEGQKRLQHIVPLVGQHLDILGFDSCVMGMLEVGYQFCEYANTLIASEGTVPNAGWTYARILGTLVCNQSGSTAKQVAKRFVTEFIKSQMDYTIGGVSVDMSAWDLIEVPKLGDAVDNMSAILVACFDDAQSDLYRRMERIILYVHWRCQSYMFNQNVDLGDFCELLRAEITMLLKDCGPDDASTLALLEASCSDVLDQLNRAVIISGFSGGDFQYSNGVSMFFPWSWEGYSVSRKNYESLWFVKDVGKRAAWSGFLTKYLGDVSLRRIEQPIKPRYKNPSFPFFEGADGDDVRSYSTASNGRLPSTEGRLPSTEGRLPGTEGRLPSTEGRLPGTEGRLPGTEGRLPSTEGRLPGTEGRLPSTEGRLPSTEGRLPGTEGRLPGTEGRLPGTEGRLPGTEGRLPSTEGRLPGTEGRLPSTEGRLPSTEGRLPGTEGRMTGGGSDKFFNSLRLFKNIETHWNVSGFSRDPTKRTMKTKPKQEK